MTINEKIYELRRQSGLTQEQLAEKLNVSRQSVSKWETGVSVPDLERLIALSELFGVSLNELTGKEEPAHFRQSGAKRRVGAFLAVFGALLLALTLVTTALLPKFTQAVDYSSTVTISGTGFLMIFCVFVMIVGLFLCLRRK